MSKPNKKRMNSCCNGKKKYNSLQEANDALHGMMRKKEKQGALKVVVSAMRAYGCPCGKFHFGRTRGINWDLIK